MYVILVYDIYTDENSPKVQRKVFSICKKYLTHIQKSVFEGNLTKLKLMELEKELKKHIRQDLDSVVIFKSREERWLQKEFWGKKDDFTSRFI
ncbi:CRISPR-associated endonuclease Cas2 [Peptostreptococcus canis]|uniref:CRISPR-associated endoribonuclease Cas2 n=1 Tax=Peptostreptococcus canis TaxID=1159213 RepID=A0ABR6TMA4_9FIRM|nr:CRISPR-associated endonuclease Cas2 [Peptostreptococcus canis]MBC2576294.1 CRISPR-associated endonuclease Cas2 [Peptostreptococcus canis]MBP1998492.1 CRISPR-associated protein Cas2 [Peptostreptococcus canis]